MTDTVTYTTEGHLYVITSDGFHVYIGDYDADGAEWDVAVDALLGEGGYVRTGEWDGDTAPVARR